MQARSPGHLSSSKSKELAGQWATLSSPNQPTSSNKTKNHNQMANTRVSIFKILNYDHSNHFVLFEIYCLLPTKGILKGQEESCSPSHPALLEAKALSSFKSFNLCPLGKDGRGLLPPLQATVKTEETDQQSQGLAQKRQTL